MTSGTISAMNTGERITIGGLAVQLVFFSIFIIAATIFHHRIRKNPTQKSMDTNLAPHSWHKATWKTVMLGLYVASILILIRSIFRLIEYAQGNDGYLISHEVFMYVFDSALMFVTMIAMSICHPSSVLAPLVKTPDVSLEAYSTSTR